MVKLYFEDRWGKKLVGEYKNASTAGKEAMQYLKREGIVMGDMHTKTNPKTGNKEYVSDMEFKFILIEE